MSCAYFLAVIRSFERLKIISLHSVPIRCIRIHTNIDLTKVRFNSVQYNIRDLESKIYVPERNKLIVDTWLQYVRDKRTVVFCASVKHAEQIAEMFREAGIMAASVSGGMKQSEWLSAFSKRKGLQHINPHAFRHTAASILVTQGIDIVTVSKMLGHARVSTTEDIYSHVIEASKELASDELANVYYRNEAVNE